MRAIELVLLTILYFHIGLAFYGMGINEGRRQRHGSR